MNYSFVKLLVSDGSRSANAVLVSRDTDKSVFYVSADGTFQCCGGWPFGLQTTPDAAHCCCWNLGEHNSIADAVSAFNVGIARPDAFAPNVKIIAEGEITAAAENKIDLVELFGTPHVVAIGLADYTSSSSMASAEERRMGEGLFSDHYTKTKVYEGQKSYHAHHGETPNKPVSEYNGHFVGIELEVIGRSASSKAKINSKVSNWFYQESDSSLDDYGVELITIPLLPTDAKDPEFWRPLCDFLNPLATSWNRSCCGLHVHISSTLLGSDSNVRSENLGKLLYFYHHIVTEDENASAINTKVYGRAHTYSEHGCKTKTGEAVTLLGKDVLKEKSVCEKVSKAMREKAGESRYCDINIDNTHTIEFRKGKGSICAERIAAVVAWSEAMIKYCNETSWVDLSFDGFIEYIRKDKSMPASLLGFIVVDR